MNKKLYLLTTLLVVFFAIYSDSEKKIENTLPDAELTAPVMQVEPVAQALDIDKVNDKVEAVIPAEEQTKIEEVVPVVTEPAIIEDVKPIEQEPATVEAVMPVEQVVTMEPEKTEEPKPVVEQPVEAIVEPIIEPVVVEESVGDIVIPEQEMPEMDQVAVEPNLESNLENEETTVEGPVVEAEIETIEEEPEQQEEENPVEIDQDQAIVSEKAPEIDVVKALEDVQDISDADMDAVQAEDEELYDELADLTFGSDLGVDADLE